MLIFRVYIISFTEELYFFLSLKNVSENIFCTFLGYQLSPQTVIIRTVQTTKPGPQNVAINQTQNEPFPQIVVVARAEKISFPYRCIVIECYSISCLKLKIILDHCNFFSLNLISVFNERSPMLVRIKWNFEFF